MTQPTEPELVHLDPSVLAAHPDNIRDELGDLTDLTASIAARGVLEPLIVVPDGDGYRILAGHRRNAAALAAAQTTVPCIVRADLAGGSDQVITMLVENIHRRDLTLVEEVRGYAQLALAGLTPVKIAKATGTRPAQVKRSLTVAGSDLAKAAISRYPLTRDQALAVAEFDTNPEAVKLLVVTATTQPYRWDHVLARLRADRDEELAYAATVARLTATGVRVAGDEEALPDTAIRLAQLTDPAGEVLDEEGHAGCPGHLVIVDPYDLDTTVAYCDDPGGNGHRRRDSPAGLGRPAARTGEDGKLTEQARAERRSVIEGNRAWRAARQVRREFLRHLLARKTAPKGTLRYVTETIVAAPQRLSDGGEDLMVDLIGGPSPTGDKWSWQPQAGPEAARAATDARLPLVLLAQVAAATETALGDHTWRHDRPTQAAAWLTWLASVGYSLSDIETRLVTAGATPAAGD
jgi:ParB family chromosome partitioning protein